MTQLPIHPVVVHFTIALFSISILFDLIGTITENDKWHQAGWYNLIFAGVASLLSILTGLIDSNHLQLQAEAARTLDNHKTSAFIISAIILGCLFWRIALKGYFPSQQKLIYYGISLIGFLVLVYGSYQGGKLVYRYGVGVHSSSTPEKLLEEKTDKPKFRPPDDLFLPADSSTSLTDEK
jgi:uncharacterized membrane protein